MSEPVPPDESPSPAASAVDSSDADQPNQEATTPRRPSRVRTITVGFLVLLASITALVSTVGVWAYRQVFNTDVFVRNVDTIVKDSQVQARLASYLTDQVAMAINADQRARQALPPQAQALVGPVGTAIRDFIQQNVQKVLATSEFQTLINKSVRLAHQDIITLLEGKKTAGGLVVQGNEVVLNFDSLINRVLQLIQQQGLLGNVSIPPLAAPDGQPSQQVQEISSRLGVTLPSNFGQIVIFKSDKLKQAQDGLHLIRRGLVLIIIVTVVLIALGLLLSSNRLRTLAELGIGIALAMLVALVVIRAVTRAVVNSVRTQSRGATSAVVHGFLDNLETIAIILVVVGTVVALVGFIFGRSRGAARVRTGVAGVAKKAGAGAADLTAGPVSRFAAAHRDGLYLLGCVIAFLLLLLIGVSWPAFIVAVAVLAVWEGIVFWLTRRASSQPPSAEPAAPAGA